MPPGRPKRSCLRQATASGSASTTKKIAKKTPRKKAVIQSPLKEDEPKEDPVPSLDSSNENEENLPPRKNTGKVQRRSPRAATQKKIVYNDDMDSTQDSSSDDEDENCSVELHNSIAMKGGKRSAAAVSNRKTKTAANSKTKNPATNKKQKVLASPTIRPPGNSSPRRFGRLEESPEDWRVTSVIDY